MADLQVCYFCGSGPDGSLGEYAVVPPGLDPTDEQQLSVVLCPECRGKLTTVMEPVVDAADAANTSTGAGKDVSTSENGGADTDTTTDADTTTDVDTDADVDTGTATAGTTDTESDVGDPAAADSPAEPGGADDPVADAATGGGQADTDAPGAGDEVDVPPAETDEDGDEVSIDPRGERASGDADPGDQAGEARAGASDANESSDRVPSPDQTPPHADDELVGRNNEAYNKTLRLLQNREFPVERHEIEQVAANAYQLDPQEVSDAIDSLVQKGLLSQEGAHLQRP